MTTPLPFSLRRHWTPRCRYNPSPRFVEYIQNLTSMNAANVMKSLRGKKRRMYRVRGCFGEIEMRSMHK